MPVGIENQAYGVLAGGISAVAVAVSIQVGQGARFGLFPAGTHKNAALIKPDGSIEWVKITGRSADSLTIARGQQGSTAMAFSIGERIEMVPDKATMAEFLQLGLTGQSLVAAGTVTAMTATLVSGGDAAALLDGFQLTVRALGANTSTAPTFNLTIGSSATGAKIIVRPDGAALAAGDIPALGFRMQLLYNAALDRWVLQNPAVLSPAELAQAPHWSANAIINGDMLFARRGVVNNSAVGNSFAGYTLDRWQSNRSGDVAGLNVYQSTDADVPAGNQRALIMQRTAGNTAVEPMTLFYSATLEDSIPLQGRQVAFTFRAKRGANYSGGPLVGQLVTTAAHTGVDERVYNFASPVYLINQINTLTTSWQTFTAFATIPADTKQFGLIFLWTPAGTAGADDTVRITRVRTVPAIVRAGIAVAAPDVPPTPFDIEQARCERYFERLDATAYASLVHAAGYGTNGVGEYINVPYRTPKRVTPTVSLANAAWTLTNAGTPTLIASSARGFALQFTPSAPGGTQVLFNGGFIDSYAEV